MGFVLLIIRNIIQVKLYIVYGDFISKQLKKNRIRTKNLFGFDKKRKFSQIFILYP